jgi:hypothetical protein
VCGVKGGKAGGGEKVGKNFPAQKIYIKFFGGNIFSAMRVVFSVKNSYQKTSACATKNFEM